MSEDSNIKHLAGILAVVVVLILIVFVPVKEANQQHVGEMQAVVEVSAIKQEPTLKQVIADSTLDSSDDAVLEEVEPEEEQDQATDGDDPLLLGMTPRQYLKHRTNELGYSHHLLNAIITCESQWRMVQNEAGSSAFGYFQILDKTETDTPQFQRGQRKFDPFVNIEMGIYLYSRYGTSPWLESKHCWG